MPEFSPKPCSVDIGRRNHMRIAHYLNQFFGGLGGEEHAGTPLEQREGPVGPGRLLQQTMGPDATVVTTLVCGDNYGAENIETVTEQVLEMVKASEADLFVAGPCFEAGRYGIVAGHLCAAVQEELGIPAVTAMAEENPGVDLYRQDLCIVDSGATATAMQEVMARMCALGHKLLAGEPVGRPSDDGYFPRGILRDEMVNETSAQRLVAMAIAKGQGEDFDSELVVTTFEPVEAPPPIQDLSGATIAVVTDGGLVPKGNPDRIPNYAAHIWGSYDISEVADLRGEDYEVAHRGYDTRYVQQDPDRLVPVDVLREMEEAGIIGKVFDEFLSTSGLANPLANSRRLGREMAQKLKESGVDAVVLTSA